MREGEPKLNLEEIKKAAAKEGLVSEKEMRELESLELHTNLLQPEAFEENLKDAPIEDIASNGNYTFVVRKIGEVPRVQIYSEVGLVKRDETSCFSNFTYEDFLKTVRKAGINGWYKSNYETGSTHNVSNQIEKYYSLTSDEDIKKAGGTISDKSSGGSRDYVRIEGAEESWKKNKLLSFPVLPPKPFRVKTTPKGDWFILRYGEETLIFVVRKDNKNQLPQEWIPYSYKNKESLKKANQKKDGEKVFAELDEYFVYDDKSRIVSEANMVATFSEKEILTFVDKETRTNYFRAGARDFDLDPADGKTVHFIKSEGKNIFGTIDATQAKSKQWDLHEREAAHIPGKIQEMKFDPNGNFIVIIQELPSQEKDAGAAKKKISILEKDTLEIVKEYDNINAHLEVDPTGTIYYEDMNHQLRAITTNFLSFPKGGLETIKQKRVEKLKALQEKIGGLTIEEIKAKKNKIVAPSELREDIVKEQLRQKVSELFAEEIGRADNLEKVGEIQDKINVLKNDPDFLQYPEVFFDIENKAREQSNAIKTSALESIIKQIGESSQNIENFEDALSFESELNEMLKIRGSTSIASPEKRKEIDKVIKELEKKAEEAITKYQGELLAQIEKDFSSASEVIREASSKEELKDAVSSREFSRLEERVSQIRDRARQKEWRDKGKALIAGERVRVEEKSKGQEEEERFQLATRIEEANAVLDEVKDAIGEEFKTAAEYDRWLKSNSPVITRYRAKILALPDKIRREKEEELQFIIDSRKQEIGREKAIVFPQEGTMVKFGNQEFPVFKEEEVFWKPDMVMEQEGANEGRLIFRDTKGRVFATPMFVKKEDLNDKELMGIYSEAAKNFFEQFKRQVPKFDENWDVSEFYQGKLEEMAKLFKVQMEQKRGIVILEGEAGTGKNVLLDMFSHFTNREVFNFSCNLQTEKEDITYAFRFDPKKGTYQVESKVIEALKTPGAIIIFDEINSLPKGVTKMLNPLTDYRRTLFFPEGKKSLKAHPSVLIAGTENPQHYLGVNPLSQEVKSRARIMKVGYPPEKIREAGKEKTASFEARILRRYADSLKNLKPDEFETLWNFVINGEKDNGGDRFETTERERDIKKIRTIVGVANVIRSAYDAFRTGKSNDIIEFVFSLREGIDIASEMGETENVKDSIKNVILPKISDPQEAERVQTIIDNY